MINAKSVGSTLRDRLTSDSAVLKDFADLTAFAAVLSGHSSLAVPAMAALILKTAGACLGSATRLIARVSPEPDAPRPATPHAYERFRVLFYVLSQQAYFAALAGSAALKEVAQGRSAGVTSSAVDVEVLAKKFEETAALIDEAEIRFHYSIDPSSRSLPLFDAYTKWLDTALAPGVPQSARQKITAEVAGEARKRLHVALAVQDPTRQWMREYLALATSQETSEHLVSELASIRQVLAGWTTPLSLGSEQRSARWSSYRNLMKSLPDQKESMYNEDFGVSRVFVAPRTEYHRAGLPRVPDEKEIAPDLGRLLGALVSERLDGTDLIILSGGPGCGKSTMCRVIASELAKDEAMHPVFLKLRRCRETSDLSSFIEDSLIKEGVITRLADLRELPNVVLILDGFDELVLASRARLRHFFSVLLDDVRSGPLRQARVIVSGRDTLFPKGEGLPRGSHVLSILPFDEPRVALWAERWRSMHEETVPGSRFHPELLFEPSATAGSSALQQLAAWPLTLHLLAKVHTAGLLDLSKVQAERIEKAYLYRSILHETSLRQMAQATGRGRLGPDEMREFLRSLAWAMYVRSVDSMALEEVLPVAREFFPGQDEGALAELAEVAIVNAPEIQKGEETGFEFVHKSFAEYLTAERIARTVEHVSHRIPDIDGKEVWHLGFAEATRAMANVLCARVVPAEIQDLLEPMIGSFISFQRGERVDDTITADVRVGGLRRVQARIDELLGDFLSGKSLGLVTELPGVSPLARGPLEMNANYGVGLALLGCAAARGQFQESEGKERSTATSFLLGPFEGALWRWLMLVHAGGVVVDGELATRLYDGSRLRDESGDWELPVRLGLLPSLGGYRADLEGSLEHHFRYVRTLVQFLSLVLVSMARNLVPGKGGDQGRQAPRRGSKKRSIGAEIQHLLRHAAERLEFSEGDVIEELTKHGFMAVRNQKRRGRVWGATDVEFGPGWEDIFRVSRVPADLADRIYSEATTALCGPPFSVEQVDRVFELAGVSVAGEQKRKRGRRRPRVV